MMKTLKAQLDVIIFAEMKATKSRRILSTQALGNYTKLSSSTRSAILPEQISRPWTDLIHGIMGICTELWLSIVEGRHWPCTILPVGNGIWGRISDYTKNGLIQFILSCVPSIIQMTPKTCMCSTVHADSGRKVTRHKEHWVMNIRSDRNGLGWKRSGRYFHRGTGIVHWMEAGTGIVQKQGQE